MLLIRQLTNFYCLVKHCLANFPFCLKLFTQLFSIQAFSRIFAKFSLHENALKTYSRTSVLENWISDNDSAVCLMRIHYLFIGILKFLVWQAWGCDIWCWIDGLVDIFFQNGIFEDIPDDFYVKIFEMYRLEVSLYKLGLKMPLLSEINSKNVFSILLKRKTILYI